jgi:hypothetical protein
MRTRDIFILAMAASALSFALASCGLEQSPTSAAWDTADDGLVTAVDSERMTISFWSTAPAVKTMGNDARAQRLADRLAAQAQRAGGPANGEGASMARQTGQAGKAKGRQTDGAGGPAGGAGER